MMSGVGVSLDYGRERAPQDVLDSLDWLAREGFVLVDEQGGPGESFGDLLVEFERSPLVVRIIRDRGQWLADLVPGHGEFVPLHVLVTAWEGSTPPPKTARPGIRFLRSFPKGSSGASFFLASSRGWNRGTGPARSMRRELRGK
jgi:hypothetical protein